MIDPGPLIVQSDHTLMLEVAKGRLGRCPGKAEGR